MSDIYESFLEEIFEGDDFEEEYFERNQIDNTIEQLIFNSYINNINEILLIFPINKKYEKFINSPTR